MKRQLISSGLFLSMLVPMNQLAFSSTSSIEQELVSDQAPIAIAMTDKDTESSSGCESDCESDCSSYDEVMMATEDDASEHETSTSFDSASDEEDEDNQLAYCMHTYPKIAYTAIREFPYKDAARWAMHKMRDYPYEAKAHQIVHKAKASCVKKAKNAFYKARGYHYKAKAKAVLAKAKTYPHKAKMKAAACYDNVTEMMTNWTAKRANWAQEQQQIEQAE